MAHWILFCQLFALGAFVCDTASASAQQVMDQDHYTAAVFEHLSVPSYPGLTTKAEARVIMNINLDAFEKQVEIAVSKGAKVIVFPEYGVTGFFLGATRKNIEPFLEVSRNTTRPIVNPCTQKNDKDRPIQQRISCMARQYSVIIVVNMATMQPCTETDPHCPSDGRYQFSTAFAFGADGTLLAIYHKTNLYTGEAQIFDAGSKTGIAEGVFETDFGTFSLFICFDILFDYPSREFYKFKIDSVISPTGWMNELPLLSGVEYQQAWALGMGMNLLAANQHYPPVQMTGSGLYSASHGASSYYYNMSSEEGRLLVADLPCFPSKTLTKRITANNNYIANLQTSLNPFLSNITSFSGSNLGKGINSTRRLSEVMKIINNVNCSLDPKMDFQKDQEPFTSLVNDDPFTLKLLTKAKDNVTVTNNGITCSVSYTLTDNWTDGDWYALGAFSGLHSVNGQYFVQACAMIRCAGQQKSTCGAETSQAHTHFQTVSVQILGYAAGKTFLTPEIVTSGVGLPKRKLVWDGSDEFDRIWTYEGRLKEPLVMAGIYGRLYAYD